MKSSLTFIFIFSLFLGMGFTGHAQENAKDDNAQDSIVYQKRYGIRLGIDLSKPIRSLIDDNYQGIAIEADYRLNNRFRPAIELGRESYITQENNLRVKSKGSYFKLGVNYNTYNNVLWMQNEIYVGLRYGFSMFSEELTQYTIHDYDHYFSPDVRYNREKFKQLNAHWIEFQVGLKTEIVRNLYLGIHAELKRIVSQKEPDNFGNLWIPGYNRNFDHSLFGIGWGYSVSYLIPITKQTAKSKR